MPSLEILSIHVQLNHNIVIMWCPFILLKANPLDRLPGMKLITDGCIVVYSFIV